MKDYLLHKSILKQVEAGNVSATSNGEGLTLFKYTPECQYDNKWNAINRQCRGIIIGDDSTIVARPFPKFFNINELPETTWNILPWHLPYEVQEKLDGSLGIGFIHNGQWRLATPGSFVSEQAIKGTEILHAKYSNFDLIGECTPLFEIIYPENRIVVDYLGATFLSLLAIFDHNGTEWHSSRVDNIANQFGFRRPKRYNLGPLSENCIQFEDGLKEGYVIRFDNGYRVKAKDPRYVQVHKLLNYMSPKGVIELIRGNEYRSTIEQLPKEIQKNFDDIRAKLETDYYLLKFKAIQHHDNMPVPRPEPNDSVEQKRELRKQSAIWIKNHVPQHLQSCVFYLIDNKDIDEMLWKIVENNLS